MFREACEMDETKEITCPHCKGKGIDPHDDGGTLAARPPCLLCQGRKTVPNPKYSAPVTEETGSEPDPLPESQG